MRLNAWVGAYALLLAAGLLASNAAARAAEPANGEETYTWSAELVSFDESSGTMTVRRRLEPHTEITDPASLSEGDRVTLVWTGRSWAANVRDVVRDSDDAEGFLKLPAEFVGFDEDRHYVSFRVAVPEDDAAQIAALEAGDWVRATSPRSGASPSDAVSAVGPYNAS